LQLRNVRNIARTWLFPLKDHSNGENGTMTLKTMLFGAASALVLSAGAANAVPATAENSLNVRSGPGTQYEVVGTIPGRRDGRCWRLHRKLVPRQLFGRNRLRKP
jgi:hypothetical protein